MKTRKRWLSLSIVLALVFLSAPATAEHHEGPARQPEMPPEMAAMMALAAPGEQHEFLKKLEGTWLSEGKFWMDPTQPPTTSMGKSINKMILGGRFLQQEFSSEFMGMPFQGLGLDGYNRQDDKCVAIWMDNMGTMMMYMEGTLDEDQRSRTMTTEFTDPMTGKPTKMKAVTTIVNEDEHRFESYNVSPDGKSFKSMEIVYKRQ